MNPTQIQRKRKPSIIRRSTILVLGAGLLYLCLATQHLEPRRIPNRSIEPPPVDVTQTDECLVAPEDYVVAMPVEVVSIPAELRPSRLGEIAAEDPFEPEAVAPEPAAPQAPAPTVEPDRVQVAQVPMLIASPSSAAPGPHGPPCIAPDQLPAPAAPAVVAAAPSPPALVPAPPQAEPTVAVALVDAAATSAQAAPTQAAACQHKPAELEKSEEEKTAAPSAPPQNLVKQYQVVRNETLRGIAKEHGVDIKRLALANGLTSTARVRPGETLFIPDREGLVVTLGEGDSLWSICKRHGVSLGSVLEANWLDDPAKLKVGQKVFLPGAKLAPRPAAKQPVQIAKREPMRDPIVVKSRSQFVWPVSGRYTSGYGWRKHPMGGAGLRFHYGVDLSAPRGTTVVAAADGVVKQSGWQGALGRTVVLAHDNGYTTVYGHNSALLVRVGQRVRQGQAIATVGSTGSSTGAHCHFEVRKNGQAVDPMKYLSAGGKRRVIETD